MTTKQIHGLVAVTEKMDTAGAATWWSLSGDTDLGALVAAWSKAGLDPELLPVGRSREVALHRAVAEQRDRKRTVQRLDDRSGWAVVDVEVSRHEADVRVPCRVWDDEEKGLICEPPGTTLADEIAAAFRRNLTTISQGDVSAWLVRQAERLNAVALRETGGIYFVPNHTLGEWRLIAGTLRETTSHTVYELPALRSDEAVKAIVDALAREAEAQATKLEEQLTADELGERALRARGVTCEQMQKKVEQYERLLGTSMTTLHERIERLQAAVAGAIFALSDDAA